MVKKVELKKNERFSDFLLGIIEKRENMSTRVYFTPDIKEELMGDWKGYVRSDRIEDTYAVSSCKGVVEVSFWNSQEMTRPIRDSKMVIYLVSSLKLDGKSYPFSLPLPEYHTSKNLLVKRK